MEPEKPAIVVYTNASPADLVAVPQNGGQSTQFVLTLGNFTWVYKDYKGDTETNKVEGLTLSQLGAIDLGSYSLSTLSGIKLELPAGITSVKQSLYDASGKVVKTSTDMTKFVTADAGSYTFELVATYNNGSTVQYLAKINFTK